VSKRSTHCWRNKAAVDQTVLTQVRERLEGSGIALESVGVKDIILPGEMKTILAQVVEAEKSAQANVIRRREETAATRSLLNTAKVMEGNPVALRMKELETLERVAERIDKISVIGGLDQVLNGLVTLRPNGS
jgi:regulator of protease activity HflC (stomatin/prohibitin superfamily)